MERRACLRPSGGGAPVRICWDSTDARPTKWNTSYLTAHLEIPSMSTWRLSRWEPGDYLGENQEIISVSTVRLSRRALGDYLVENQEVISVRTRRLSWWSPGDYLCEHRKIISVCTGRLSRRVPGDYLGEHREIISVCTERTNRATQYCQISYPNKTECIFGACLNIFWNDWAERGAEGSKEEQMIFFKPSALLHSQLFLIFSQ